jgi:tRNA/rRNA methyltransferase
MVKDRRFAGLGFKRQTPIGQHVADLVSFPLRAVIDIVPDDESPEGARARTEKRAWLSARDYRIIDVRASEVEADAAAVLERVHTAIT